MSERRSNLSTPWIAILLLLPVVAYLTLLVWQYVPLPNEDDYHALFGFALKWQQVPDLLHHIQLIVAYQHNEYKMPLPYSLLGLELALTHRLSIPLWTWTGNLLALLMLVPFWFAAARGQKMRERLLYFVPVVWLLMTVNYAETVNFAICGIQELGVVVLSLACIFCLTRESVGWKYLSCLFLFLACATYANAFMLAPIGVVVLYRDARRVLAVWFAMLGIIVAMFLYRYQFLPHPHASPLKMFAFFLALLGCPFGLHGVYVPAMVAGALVLGAFLYLARQRSWEVQPFAFWTAVWLLLGYALTSFGRGASPMANALPSRYKIYADLLLAATYVQVLELWLRGRLPRLRVRMAVPALATFLVVFESFSDAAGWYRLHLKQEYQRHGMTRYVESGGQVSPLWYADPLLPWMVRPGILEEARTMLSEATRTGLYRIPDRF